MESERGMKPFVLTWWWLILDTANNVRSAIIGCPALYELDTDHYADSHNGATLKPFVLA